MRPDELVRRSNRRHAQLLPAVDVNSLVVKTTWNGILIMTAMHDIVRVEISSMNQAHVPTERRDASQPNRVPCSELYSDRIIITTGAGLDWCVGALWEWTWMCRVKVVSNSRGMVVSIQHLRVDVILRVALATH